MGGRVIANPEPGPHSCSPGWENRWSDGDPTWGLPAGWYAHQIRVADGTIWECECGRTFVAYHLRYPSDPRKMPRGGMVDLSTHWRRERRGERRRRLRHQPTTNPVQEVD